jgi:pentatricopeptide repeat protein
MASIFFEQTMEHLSNVWLELALAALAVIAYLVLGGKKSAKATRSENNSSSCDVFAEQSSDNDHDLTRAQLALKMIRQGKMSEAISIIQHLSATNHGYVPFDVASRLLIAAAKMPKLSSMPQEFKALAGKITSASLDAAFTEAVKSKDAAACRSLHMMSGFLSIPKSQQVFEALAKAYSSDPNALRVLVEEASMPSSLVKDITFLQGVVEKATSLKEKGRESNSLEDLTTSMGSSDRSSSPDDSTSLNTLSEYQYGSSSKEITMRANDIRSCGKNGDLKGATKVFERLGSQASSTLILNSMLDACIECKDLEQAITYFNQTRNSNLVDVISYNTMMKGYIANGQEGAAKKLLAELSQKGLSATRLSYHGLLNARINARDFDAAWKLVSDMQADGISPNAVTCSILLKGKMCSLSDVSRVLQLIDAMDQPMDEVLFLSVVESCIRTGRLDLLSRQTEKFLSQSASSSLTAPTYGSMIKAYGHARDVKRVWHLWDQMLAHRVQPTSVTLGCMVEALVANGRPGEAWQLAQKTYNDEATRALVNTVIYSSILKGFAHIKETDQVLAVYKEMKANGVQANTITYNTILNAFAQGGGMHHVPALLEDMKAGSPPAEPDIVTYSTIVKGFCNAGNLDRALKVLNDMKASGKHAPDEVLYNSLLGGCAKEHRPDDALQLLNDMRKYNVAPSNYTLSMLVKLMGRCRRINQAFTMLEDISTEYGLKINIQVYTCLIQGCFNAAQPSKAIALHEKIIKEGLTPDSMTYTVLVRGCVQAGLLDKAGELARIAYGQGPMPSKSAAPGLNAGCFDELVAALGGSGSDEAKELQKELGNCQPAVPKGKGYGKGSGKGNGSRSSAPHW